MKRLALLLLPALLLLACGGSGEGARVSLGGGSTLPAAGVQIEGALAGQAGQLELDGLPLDLAAARITVDGAAATAEDLQPGMVVAATATRSATSAAVTALQATTLLSGPVTAIDAAHLRLTVLGRTVQVDSATVLAQRGEGRTWTALAFSDLKAGDLVAVHGFAQADGTVAATRIDRLPAGAPTTAAVSGLVSALDTAARTFRLDATTVDYSAATVTGTLANGARATATGAFAGTVLRAVRVMVAQEPPSLPRVLVGPVSGLDTAARTFRVGPVLVDYATATVGGTLANGVTAAVEGAMAGGVLRATRVTVVAAPPPASTWDGVAAGPVTLVDGAGALKVGTSSFWMDAATVVTGSGMGSGGMGSGGMGGGTAPSLKPGDWVVVAFDSARRNAAGAAYAVRVEVVPASAPLRPLIGVASAFNATARTFVLQGLTVQPAVTVKYAVAGREVDAATFWGASRNGAVVEAHGTAAGTTFTAAAILVR